MGTMEKTCVKSITGYDDIYGVSKDGVVWNLKKGWVIEPQRDAYVTLSKNGKLKTWRVADLVAMTWLRNVGGLRYVRHKDGNVRNNSVDNLEWCDRKECRGGFSKNTKGVLKLNLMGELVCKYGSVSDASYANGVDKSSISKCCRGLCVSAGGWIWRYE